MATSKLRIGIIGANVNYGWGSRAHLPALLAMPEFEVAAVCTAHEETAKATAQKFGARMAFHDHREMLRRPDIDAVAVVVRVPMHHQLTMDAMEAGKHVFTEWPLGANLKEAQEMAALARKMKLHTMVGLQRRASPVYLRLAELVKEGYVGQVLSVNLVQMGGGVVNRTSDRTWQRDATLGANTLTIGFGHSFDALCMVAGELTEVSAVVSTQVPQWYETDTKKYVDVTSPDNIMITGRLEGGAVVNANVGVHPYHGSGYKMEVYGKEGTLALVGGGGGGEQLRIMGGRKDDKAMKELPVPDRLKWVPQEVQNAGSAYEVGQMWVNFAKAIRTNTKIEPDFDHAVRRHRMLDAIQRASDTGQRQSVT